MPAPEAYIGGADKLLDDAGKVNNDKTREVLGKFMAAFASWVEQIKTDEHPVGRTLAETLEAKVAEYRAA